MRKPIIGVLGAHGTAVFNGNMVVDYTGLNEAYYHSIRRAGGNVMIIPPAEGEELYQLIDLCDGLLFPGGEDVDPRFYQEDPSAKIGRITREYDQSWIQAVLYARNKNIPIMGICRGLQLVNVALGGSLYQDLSERKAEHLLHGQRQDRSYPIHCVNIDEDSILSRVLGETSVYTNTMHHQSVKKPGNGLKVSAHTKDGVVEALENEDGTILLVQWHPEELQDTVVCMRKLFQHLVKEAEKVRNK